MLNQLVRNVMKKRGLSSRDVAKEISVSHTTVLRVLRGDYIDVETLVKFGDWLDVRPADLINSISTKNSLSDKVSALIQSHAGLEKIFLRVVAEIENGNLTPDVIDEFVSFMDYREKELIARGRK